MFLENQFSKIEAALEDATKPAQIEAIAKYRQNVIHGHEAESRALCPIQHKKKDHKSKWKSPGLSTSQIAIQSQLMVAHCRKYATLPAEFFISRNEAKKRKPTGSAHNERWLQQRITETEKQRAGGKKRDLGTALAQGASHKISEMVSVGKKQATGSAAAASGTANEDNTGHWAYFDKIKVRGEGARFDDLKKAISTHHPHFKPDDYGLKADCRVKKTRLQALRSHLGQ